MLIVRAYKIHEIRELIERHEGVRLKPYKDTVGVWTIGIGRNLERGISEEEARHLCYNDIIACEHDLDRDLPWWRELPKVRQMALLDMAFNLGINRLLKFKRMLAALKAEDWELAAKEALNSKWAEQVGKRAEEIAEMIRRG